MIESSETTDPRRTSGRVPLVGVAALLVILTNAIVFILPPLLPVIQAHYQLTTVSSVTWIFTLLTLGGGAGFVLMPRLSDVIGDRDTAVLSGAALTAGALIAAIGDSYAALLVGATVMGFGMAAQMLPLGFLRRSLGDNGLSIAVAVLVVATGVGIVAGMIGGGFIVQNLSLRTFLFVLAAAFAATTAASYLTIPQYRRSASGGSIGAVGTLCLIGWVGAILLALSQGVVWGEEALIPLAAGLVGAAVWLWAQRKTSTPVFDRALLKSPFVTAACVAVGLFATVNSAFLVLLSNYAQTDPASLAPQDSYGLGRTALQTGWLMVPFAVTFLVGGTVAEKPVAQGRGAAVLITGAIVSLGGLALLAVAHDRPWEYLVSAGIIGLGCSMGYASGFAVVQMAVPEEKAGMAAAIAGTAMAIGFALGSAIVTTILTASTVVIPGTDIAVANKGEYSTSYWTAVGLAALIVLTVAVSRIRTGRRATPNPA
ncbi:MFS transporter [Amycolatopsis sp. WGS_07]|uniref:MFS transporter n=1 Tax=Amycolatopsis sp. WGS_07 TaxID=3076764 RepID=UPI0038735DF2